MSANDETISSSDTIHKLTNIPESKVTNKYSQTSSSSYNNRQKKIESSKNLQYNTPNYEEKISQVQVRTIHKTDKFLGFEVFP